MAEKHSPEPWRSNVDEHYGCHNIYDANGDEIACTSGMADSDEEDGNTRLMTSAPILAAHLSKLEELWDKTNWKLFHDQKLTLLLLMDGEIDRNAAIDHLEGILSLMDAFQDVAIDRLGIAEADRSFYYPSEDE